MKLIVAGSRWFDEHLANALVKRAIRESGWLEEISEIVHGDCRTGIDAAAQRMCERRWPVRKFPAQWRAGGKLDRSAGPRRNAEMAEYADRLVLIWDGDSDGSRSMRDEAVSRLRPTFELRVDVHGDPLDEPSPRLPAGAPRTFRAVRENDAAGQRWAAAIRGLVRRIEVPAHERLGGEFSRFDATWRRVVVAERIRTAAGEEGWAESWQGSDGRPPATICWLPPDPDEEARRRQALAESAELEKKRRRSRR